MTACEACGHLPGHLRAVATEPSLPPRSCLTPLQGTPAPSEVVQALVGTLTHTDPDGALAALARAYREMEAS